ncbi:antitoxin VapB family protein [Archaeoglobus sp.]
MKTITIRDDTYEKLARLKRNGESFSDVIERLIEQKDFNISRYFGILKDSEVLEKILEYSKGFRKSARLRI